MKVPEWLTHLWTAGYNLTPDQRRRTVRYATATAAALLAVLLFAAGKAAAQSVPADHPVWEAVLQARLALVRLALAVPIVIVALACGLTIYQVMENSELGKRLWQWHESDDAYTQAAKTRNGGMVLAAILGSCILAFLLGILR